jgi:hypothetical protein
MEQAGDAGSAVGSNWWSLLRYAMVYAVMYSMHGGGLVQGRRAVQWQDCSTAARNAAVIAAVYTYVGDRAGGTICCMHSMVAPGTSFCVNFCVWFD